MKKIGILTYLREYSNLGTNMQAYCTLKAVQKAHQGARVELIDYSPRRPLMKPYLTHASAKSLRSDYVRIAKYRRFFRDDMVFSRRRLVSTDLEASLEFLKSGSYDAIYVGSDTVLELREAYQDQLTPYWLHTSVTGTKFLIAASSHNVTIDTLSNIQKEQIRSTIQDFRLLGVRDEATLRLLSHFTDAGDDRLRLIPDPTFSYDVDYRFIEKYLERKRITFDRPVICLHLLRDSSWAPTLASSFKDRGYIVASLRPAPYADLILTDLSPFEQMGLYRYFDLVITHRFHDAIFCLKNLTPVIVFPERTTDVTSYGESKIHTLLKSFGLAGLHYIANKEQLAADHLFAVHREAIATFREGRARIAQVLQDNRNRYESFVQTAAALVS